MRNDDRIRGAVALSAVAGSFHVVAAVTHAGSVPLATAFATMAALQLVLAAAVARGRVRPASSLLSAVHLIAVAAWAVSRTVGLPVIAPSPEPVGVTDAVTIVSQLGAWSLLRRPVGTTALGRRPSFATVLTIASLVSLGAITGTLTVGETHHHHDDRSAHEDGSP